MLLIDGGGGAAHATSARTASGSARDMADMIPTMRRLVYLARHGETEWNRAGRWQGQTDIPLTDAGREQARALAQALRGRPLVAAWASDLARARETAEIVAGALGLPPVALEPGLRERAYGLFEGLTREECELRFPEEWARHREDPRRVPPGGEPHERVVQRMRAGLRRVALTHDVHAEVLAVSHGGAIRMLVASITGELPPPLPNGALFRVEVLGEDFGGVERLG